MDESGLIRDLETSRRGSDSPDPKQVVTGRSFRVHLEAVLSTKHTEILLGLCCLISGLVDSTIYNGNPFRRSMLLGHALKLF